MLGTIETTNNNIMIKINSLAAIFDIFKKHSISYDKKIIDYKDEIKYEYIMGSVNVLSDYFLTYNKYKAASDENEKRELMKEKESYYNIYQNFINNENFISRLDSLMKTIKKYFLSIQDKTILDEFYRTYNLYNNSTIDKCVKEVVYEVCVCSNKMDIDLSASTLVCKICGITKELYGTVFEDDIFQYHEGNRNKHGTYDPSKHCRFWVERIQARENTEIPEAVINDIKKCIIRDKIRNKNFINCIQIRKYLQETHNSSYNEHTPLIKKLVTGVIPPQLTDYEMQLIHIYFDKVLHIFDEIKPYNKTNCPYHPYFIYKIIEQIINKDSDKIRKLKILSHIHLQSRETLICNDSIWTLICIKIPEFKYIPTDRNNQYSEI